MPTMPAGTITWWLLAAALAAGALAFVLARRFAADVAADGPQRTSWKRGGGVALAAALPLLAVALYLALGTPAGGTAGDEDAVAVPAPGHDFRERLAAHLASSTRDGRAWVALARLDMDDDRFEDAARHYAKAIEVSTKIARDPGVLCEYADALGMAQGGRLAGKPAETIERALALDPAHPKALEMAGSAAYERGDFRAAAQHWRALLAHFPEGAPARAELGAAIGRAERRASTTLPPGFASGPLGN